MTDRTTILYASMKALMTMLEGNTKWEGRTARILYNAFTGMDEQLIRANCEATIDNNYDGILAFFEPGETAPLRIGVTLMEGPMIKLQFGRLWMTPRGGHAVLVPHGVGKVHGHYAVDGGRIVQRSGWPAETLERGTRRAAAKLAELTADYARVAEAAF